MTLSGAIAASCIATSCRATCDPNLAARSLSSGADLRQRAAGELPSREPEHVVLFALPIDGQKPWVGDRRDSACALA